MNFNGCENKMQALFVKSAQIVYYLLSCLLNDRIGDMNILQIAIDAEKGKSNLAHVLEVSPSTISNWLKRGLPHMASRAIKEKYSRQISKAIKADQAAKEVA